MSKGKQKSEKRAFRKLGGVVEEGSWCGVVDVRKNSNDSILKPVDELINSFSLLCLS